MYAAGLDAIQIYVPWNIHQPLENKFDFEGQNNVFQFISVAREIGLLVIVRAGPYMDGEWEFGGLPAWILQKNPNTVFRTMDPTYIHYADLWIDKFLPLLRPLLYNNGGPVIMVQIENEYGSYFACDKNYTSHLRNKFVSHFQDEVLLFTTDGTLDSNFKCGPIPGVFATTDFGTSFSVLQFQGFTLYRHTLTSDLQKGTVIKVPGVRDRAYVMINKVSVGVLMRDTQTSLTITGLKGQNLDILVENQGHITFNKGINDNLKGIIQNVTLAGQVVQGWTMYPLQLDKYFSMSKKHRIHQQDVTFDPKVPSLYVGELTISSDVQDTYLDVTGWKKGQVFIKSQSMVNLGRYWPLKGPQERLFVPGPYLQGGPKPNQILLVELEASPCVANQTCVVKFVDTPLINGPVTRHRFNLTSGDIH